MNNISFPQKVQIIEVGPRDGFQSIKTFIESERKLSIIDGLVNAGLDSIEVTSFVNPKAIPQLADAAVVAETVRKKYPELLAAALIPNLRGAENAAKAGIENVTYVISASEAHNKANVNRTISESVNNLKEMMETYPDLKVQLDVATAFGCPYSGETPIENVINLIKEAQALGVWKITLCDTIGIANPAQVTKMLVTLKEQFPDMIFALHMHNTRGMALANMAVAASLGITIFETSIGGLGGCPFAPGSEGNAATEDAVNMFNNMGIETGIDLDKLLDVVREVEANVDAPITGKMLKVVTSTCANISGKA